MSIANSELRNRYDTFDIGALMDRYAYSGLPDKDGAIWAIPTLACPRPARIARTDGQRHPADKDEPARRLKASYRGGGELR